MSNKIIKLLIIVLSGSILLLSCNKEEHRFYKPKNGYFKQSITETGSLYAMKSRAIVMPRIGYRYGHSFKIVDIAEHGSEVSQGDTVIKIDQSQILKYIVDMETNYEQQLASKNKMIVNHRNSIKSLETALKTNAAEFEMKKLQMERSKFEPKNKQKILELEFQKAQIDLDKSKLKIDLKESINRNEMRIMDLRLDQTKNRIEGAYESLGRFYLTSPQDGLFVVEYNRRTEQIYKIGDEVHNGREMATVPDLSTMKIKSQINETDIKEVHLGQPVTFKLDAFPKLSFSGKVSYISRLSRYQRRATVKTFDIEIEVDGKDDRLKPGMTVSCEFIINESENAQYIENNCIYKEDKNYYVFIMKGNSIQKTPIEIGPRNASHTVVTTMLDSKSKILPYSKALNLLNI